MGRGGREEKETGDEERTRDWRGYVRIEGREEEETGDEERTRDRRG